VLLRRYTTARSVSPLRPARGLQPASIACAILFHGSSRPPALSSVTDVVVRSHESNRAGHASNAPEGSCGGHVGTGFALDVAVLGRRGASPGDEAGLRNVFAV